MEGGDGGVLSGMLGAGPPWRGLDVPEGVREGPEGVCKGILGAGPELGKEVPRLADPDGMKGGGVWGERGGLWAPAGMKGPVEGVSSGRP